MMLDPLRVKNHLEPVRIFFSTAVPFFRRLIEASRSIIKLPISFFEFSQSSDSESDEIIFVWVLLKTTVNFSKRLLWCLLRGLSFIQVLELFFFFTTHRLSTMTRPFSLSESVVICHGLVLTVTPYVFERLPKWTVHVRGSPKDISTGSFQSFDDFISGLWFLHF